MEEDAKAFLKRIVWSIGLALLWMVTNLGIGTYNHLLVPENGVSAGNIIFYSWMVLSLSALIWLLIRIWKRRFPHG